MLTLSSLANSTAQETMIHLELILDERIIKSNKYGDLQLYRLNDEGCLQKFAPVTRGDSLYFKFAKNDKNMNSVNLGIEFGKFFILFDSVNLVKNEINFIKVMVDTRPFRKVNFSEIINWESVKTIYSMTLGPGRVTVLNRPVYKKKQKKYCVQK